MCGNVWEWCLSSYENPQHEARDEQLDNEKFRVLHGGSWGLNDLYCRSAIRLYSAPGGRDNDSGFRVVLSSRTS
jgi:formylglycine-generating enzyme required for sulfatase activity